SGSGYGFDASILFDIGEWEVAVKGPPLLHHLISLSLEQDTPLQSYRLSRSSLGNKGSDGCRVIVGQRVVLLRLVSPTVCSVRVIQKDGPCLVGSNSCVIEIDLFSLAIICAQADHIAFITDGINQLVIAKEAANRRIALSHFLARFDRHCNISFLTKVKADNR